MGEGIFGKVRLGTHVQTQEKVRLIFLLQWTNIVGGHKNIREEKDQRPGWPWKSQQGNTDS